MQRLTLGGDAPARNEFWFVSGRKYDPFVSTTSGMSSLGAPGHLTTNTQRLRGVTGMSTLMV